MRLIDADKLIDDINRLWDWESVIGITAKIVLRQTITDIENQPTVESRPKGKWVPCSERLPDKGLRVLMQLNNAWHIVGWYDKEDKQWFELIYAEPISNNRVLAWMPLPEPYRGDNE